jgi:hypothetical protein
MPTALIGPIIGAVGGIGSALIGSHASHSAANAQADSAAAGIAEQQREYDQTRSDLLPWLRAGQSGLGGELDLLGLHGGTAQQAAIDALQNSPQFASLNRQGEQAILQNASATGGLRGGNIQASLYNQRADLLAQLIDQQYSRLGAISGAGAATGAQLGGFGANTANAIAQLLGSQGAARAGGILGGASALTQGIGSIAGFLQTPGLFGSGGGFGYNSYNAGYTMPVASVQPLSTVPGGF